MSIQSPQELLLHELHGIEDAESEASQALEEQMEEVENSKLRKLLERRLKQGERLQKEIKRNLQKLNGESEGRENEAARGLIDRLGVNPVLVLMRRPVGLGARVCLPYMLAVGVVEVSQKRLSQRPRTIFAERGAAGTVGIEVAVAG